MLPALRYYFCIFAAYSSFSLFSLEHISTELLPPTTLQSCLSRSPPSCSDRCSSVGPLSIYSMGNKDTGAHSLQLTRFLWLGFWGTLADDLLPRLSVFLNLLCWFFLLPLSTKHCNTQRLSTQIPSFSTFAPYLMSSSIQTSGTICVYAHTSPIYTPTPQPTCHLPDSSTWVSDKD